MDSLSPVLLARLAVVRTDRRRLSTVCDESAPHVTKNEGGEIMVRTPCKAVPVLATCDAALARTPLPPHPPPFDLILGDLAWRRVAALLAAILATAGLVPTTSVEAQTSISTDGVIESKSGGFKFPDGSVQTAAAAPIGSCTTLDPSDEMIWIGGVCIDKYEASIWDAPVGGNEITVEIASEYCNLNGQDCDNIWARSVAGREPARRITWFQAQAALANSGKRLPTNAEWQMAVRGTPGNNNCNVLTGDVANTGIFGNCVSAFGAYDMVGNLWEWVADWVPATTGCPGWGAFSDDAMCLSGASTTTAGPDALLRGGDYVSGSGAGPFAVVSEVPWTSGASVGFRGAR
ncbi:MAG TPA: SUMF1/EgtB/PvdO family nonheme iron enzyme [Thermoanaerobaculia bacterium]|nr:SUMF1/EgtB/PvdO family nonheme iron enzyme [Thermoanaerobaculia bacterium]